MPGINDYMKSLNNETMNAFDARYSDILSNAEKYLNLPKIDLEVMSPPSAATP